MPTLAFTYTTLRQALQEWPENAGAQYVAALDQIIGLGELRLMRDLNLEIFDHLAFLNLSAGERLIEKPEDWIATRSLRLMPETFYLLAEDGDMLTTEGGDPLVLEDAPEDQGEVRSTGLEQRSWDFCQSFAPDPTVRRRPRYFNELNATQWEVVDTADRNYTVVCRYMRRPQDLLSASNPNATSWLSSRVPDALFAACLMEAEHFLKADDRYGDFARKYHEEILPTARAELRSLIRAGDYSPVRSSAQVVR